MGRSAKAAAAWIRRRRGVGGSIEAVDETIGAVRSVGPVGIVGPTTRCPNRG